MLAVRRVSTRIVHQSLRIRLTVRSPAWSASGDRLPWSIHNDTHQTNKRMPPSVLLYITCERSASNPIYLRVPLLARNVTATSGPEADRYIRKEHRLGVGPERLNQRIKPDLRREGKQTNREGCERCPQPSRIHAFPDDGLRLHDRPSRHPQCQNGFGTAPVIPARPRTSPSESRRS